MAAARYTLTADKHLDQGLKWADAAVSMPFIGQANFTTLGVKAQILAKMGQKDEAKKVMDAALKLPGTTSLEIHQYGRQLLMAKQVDEALQVFQYNAERNGDAWPVHVGLARAYMAKGDLKQALDHAQKAAKQAPDEVTRRTWKRWSKPFRRGRRTTSS